MKEHSYSVPEDVKKKILYLLRDKYGYDVQLEFSEIKVAVKPKENGNRKNF